DRSYWRFVARLLYEDDELLIEPISILRSEDKTSPVFQLAFDSFSGQKPKGDAIDIMVNPAAGSLDERDLDEGQFDEPEADAVKEPFVPGTAGLGRVLTDLNSRLLTIAQTAAQKGLAMHQQSFLRSTKELHGLGLTTLARSLSSL